MTVKLSIHHPPILCLLRRSVVSSFSGPHGLQPIRLLCPWDFTGKNTGGGYHSLLHIFPTQRSKLCLLPLLFGRQILYHSATWEAPPDKLSSWNGEKSSGPTVVVLKDWSSYLGSFSQLAAFPYFLLSKDIRKGERDESCLFEQAVVGNLHEREIKQIVIQPLLELF